jgi:hypothetical protein
VRDIRGDTVLTRRLSGLLNSQNFAHDIETSM